VIIERLKRTTLVTSLSFPKTLETRFPSSQVPTGEIRSKSKNSYHHSRHRCVS